MKNRTILAIALAVTAALQSRASDPIPPSGFRSAPQWLIGAELSPAWVPGTDRKSVV